MVHRVKITGGNGEGSISACSGHLFATSHEDASRQALLREVERVGAVRAVYLQPADPSIHQTLYVGMYPHQYDKGKIPNDPSMALDPTEFLETAPQTELMRLVAAFMKDSMSHSMYIELASTELFFSKETSVAGVSQ